MKKLFVTGLSGFVGRSIQKIVSKSDSLELCVPRKRVDILDTKALNDFISSHKIDYVIHLAGMSHVPTSFRDPKKAYETNFFGTLNLLNALQQNKFSGRFLYVSSGDVYGLVKPEQLPLDESQPLKPRSPYAVSKVAAETMCYQWSQTEAMDIMVARPFNHIGAGQSEGFAVTDFARQIAEIHLGLREPVIKVGDLTATRDFTDVDDVAAAYFSLLKSGHTGEIYNVCSSKELSLDKILKKMLDLAKVDAEIVVETALLRPSEQKRVMGSRNKITSHTGWMPQVPLDETLMKVLNDWEVRLTHG